MEELGPQRGAMNNYRDLLLLLEDKFCFWLWGQVEIGTAGWQKLIPLLWPPSQMIEQNTFTAEFFKKWCVLKSHNITFSILTISRVQFSDLKYIHIVVQLLLPSIHRTLSSCKTYTSCPLNNSSPFSSPSPWTTILLSVSMDLPSGYFISMELYVILYVTFCLLQISLPVSKYTATTIG